MDALRFDALVRTLSAKSTRRGVFAGLTGGLLVLLPRGDAADAKRKRKKRKKPTAACAGRVCGPNAFGTGSCGDCGVCKTCEGGACFAKANGTGCGGECLECRGGACVAKAAGTPCGTGGTCVDGVCCAAADRVCGTLCCPAGTICIDAGKHRCAPACDAACDDRRPRCGCALPFDSDLDFCNVNPEVGTLCALPDCDSQEDCAPNGVCARVSCGGNAVPKCLEACPA